MTNVTVALLHPGEMGAAVGACLTKRNVRVLWSSEGRSPATEERARAAGLADRRTLAATVGECDLALAVCPPHGALDLAKAVAALGFRGLYVDANAVSPATTRQIGQIVEAGGATFVDGGVVGPPPGSRTGSGTRLYLSGKAAERVAALFAGSELEALVLDRPIGAASALKVCYGTWNKGSIALLADVLALAAHEGVGGDLAAEWQRSQPDAVRRTEAVRNSARKAWRWIVEMEENAATFAAAGLPDGFTGAAAEIYRRLASYKEAPAAPPLEDIKRSLTSR